MKLPQTRSLRNFLPLRGQYLFSPETIPLMDGWKAVRTRTGVLQFHAEQQVAQQRADDRCVTLIGYIVEPRDEGAREDSAVERVFQSARDLRAVLEVAAGFGGRWVLLVETPEHDVMVHDACGLRQVFYSQEGAGTRFCASQALTAERVLELQPDIAAKEFLQTHFPRMNGEYWWPGDSTQFRGVKCLLPNHYLNLRSRKPHRYGIEKRLQLLSLERASTEAAEMLSYLVRSVARKYEVALPLTAGWDSRVLLAACRAVGVVPYCYTLKFGKLTDRSPDIAVPRELLARVGWQHHVISCSERPNTEFVDAYRGSVDPAHIEACRLGYGLSQGYPKGMVSLSGHCGELGRCMYSLELNGEQLRAKDLANLTGMDTTEFVLRELETWLENARRLAESSRIRLLDLFYWEQRAGRWAANGQSQWDLVHERFTAYNCRPLLLTLLSVEEKHRKAPGYALNRAIVENLDPSVLELPVNPRTGTAENKSWMADWWELMLAVTRSPRNGYAAFRQRQ
jgi:hypothetical protein